MLSSQTQLNKIRVYFAVDDGVYLEEILFSDLKLIPSSREEVKVSMEIKDTLLFGDLLHSNSSYNLFLSDEKCVFPILQKQILFICLSCIKYLTKNNKPSRLRL